MNKKSDGANCTTPVKQILKAERQQNKKPRNRHPSEITKTWYDVDRTAGIQDDTQGQEVVKLLFFDHATLNFYISILPKEK